MTEHYYSRNPGVESKPLFFNYTLRGNSFRFKTDQGVFSKNEIDFGSRLLIESFTVPEIDGPILDVGCGYGPVGLSIAKSEPDCIVHMVDVNDRALELAKENASFNHISNVKIYESDRFENISNEKFSAVVTNPPIRAGKKVVHDILTKSYDYLLPQGELWVVIQKKQGAPSAKEKMSEIFDEIEVVCKDKGYYILKAKKG
ncbi:class I SAM-dependent methyltransferase [Heyndrickxia camelliae]|uniref:16S rRNA methyltransferase n=1 Tax=Heyndrickxia camelliae TaxID=1707093 RepID=A0A2N3LEY3_9BACI|nr:class I SAM-dependent methyltransferase [Heyndrickxia camelliae]PKR83104.1 16S rRNA methyltransferase [Heyndrickxia camelliae]